MTLDACHGLCAKQRVSWSKDMDQDRFDNLTRSLSAGMSRRAAMRGLSATALGGVLAVAGIGSAAAAACKRPNVKCGKGKNAVCCSAPRNGSVACNGLGGCAYTCDDGYSWDGAQCLLACVPDRTCDGYYGGYNCGSGLWDGCGYNLTCGCPDGKFRCDGQACTTLEVSAHCGACDNVCACGGCEIDIEGNYICSAGGECRSCTRNSDCRTGYHCIDLGYDFCGAGYTTVCDLAC